MMLVFCFQTLKAEESDASGRLLVSKQILNKYIVQDMDLIVKYTLYNIGNNAATKIVISDTSFNSDTFEHAGGQLKATIDRIPPGANVSHTVVLRPVRIGPYNFTAAKITYETGDESSKVQEAVSSEPGEGYIVAFRDYDKKFSPHLLDWGAFAMMTLPSLAIPFLLWWSSKSKYETLSSKHKKNQKD
ncbi:hypothetical protein AAG570_007826 [Ranatra chinensis]|uniref:Translocon-associated protein subunit beta n=1 Tax=Ranatra chinensis TaxID=642074 RepID=A0ABD0Y9X7_9HEMI